MNTRIYTFAFTAFLLVACTEKNADINKIQGEKPVFEAVTEGFDDTKTTLTTDNKVIWSKNDRLAIFQGFSIADEYQVTESSIASGNASFTLASDNSNKNNDDFASGQEISTNVAYYPYTAGITCSNDGSAEYEVGVTLPSVQTFANNSFGNGSFPMVAVTSSVSDHTLRFMNVCGAIKLQVMGDVTVKSMKIQGNNGEKLAGAATVHAYVDGTAPAINMAETAGTSVTLDCGDGIKLEEGSATSFYIALPPVLLSAGFTITVTDTEGNETTVKTDRANTVFRSSVLVMQPFKLGQAPSDEDQDQEIPVATIKINERDYYLVFAPGGQFTFTAALTPLDVPAEYLSWTSSDASVATIDPSTGVMTAVGGGTATITAEAGGKKDEVTVECYVTTAVPTADYVDEYGINHGKGIALGKTVWAPVNCGYNEANYPYGKLYQWGRKYGQGYSGTYGDVSEPVISDGPVSRVSGESEANSNVFYMLSYNNSYTYDWLAPQENNLWNDGTDGVPVKTKYDPCPEGWRVPTDNELERLNNHRMDDQYDASGMKGVRFFGYYRAQDDAPSVFLPYAGLREYYGSSAARRSRGFYWSSTCCTNYTSLSYFLQTDYSSTNNGNRASGMSVRCVQE